MYYPQFNSAKFFCREDAFGHREFVPTSAYVKYLQEKRKAELENEIICLKDKLELEQKTYGQVDPIDVDRYIYLCKMSYGQ